MKLKYQEKYVLYALLVILSQAAPSLMRILAAREIQYITPLRRQ